MRTYEFRLYPNRSQRHRLDTCLYEARQLYNQMLACQQQHYQYTGAFLTRYDLNKQFKGRGGSSVPATTVQCLSDRLTKALQNFLKHKDDDWGFPRFKSAHQWHSIQLRQFAQGKDAWLDGRVLRVPGKLGSAIKIKRHREIAGTPKTCYLVKRADSHWHALIVCEVPCSGDVLPRGDDRPSIGIDVGLKVFLADSDGHTIDNPRLFRTSQASLRRKQRRLSARTKDRDVNAAKNILQAGAPPSGTLADRLAGEPRSRLLMNFYY